MTDLTDHLLATHDLPADPEAREAWRIEDDDLAAWALRKVAAAQAELVRVSEQAQAEVERIAAWEQQAEAGPIHDVEFFTNRLEDYGRRLLAADPSLPKTYRLPTGVIKRAKVRDRVDVTDKAAYVAWALQHAPHTLTASPRVTDVSEAFGTDGEKFVTTDGEVVPGVRFVEGTTERWSVSAGVDS